MKPSIAEVRRVTQPPEIRGRQASEHWLNDIYLRRLSPYQTRLFLATSISANQITGLMILCGAAVSVALLIPGPLGGVLAFVLGQYQMLLDCSDGEVARWRQQFSPAGIFLDKVGHYTAEGLLPIALGIRAAGGSFEVSSWLVLGLLLSILVIFNKALNDMVHVARAFNNLPRLSEEASVGQPSHSMLARVRRLARFVPFHRLFHSVEMSAFAAVAALIDFSIGALTATQWLLFVLLGAAVLTVPGHLVAILTSRKLR